MLCSQGAAGFGDLPPGVLPGDRGVLELPEDLPPPPAPPTETRDLLDLSAIQAWQALAAVSPAPDLDPAGLEQAIYEAFVTRDGHHQVDKLCDGWLDLARQCGLAVEGQDGELLIDVLDAISHTISQAIWFGLTTGYLTLTGRYTSPASSFPATRTRQITRTCVRLQALTVRRADPDP